VYNKDDSLDLTGLVVAGDYSLSGAVPLADGDYTLEWGGSPIVHGNTTITAAAETTETITVAWQGKTTAFTIRVRADGAVYDEATWNTKLQAIKDGGNGTSGTPLEHTIEVDGDVTVAGSTAASFGTVQYVEITLKGSGTVSLSSNGSLVNLINANQTLIIDSEDLTLEGKADNNQAVILLDNDDASLELKKGFISDNTNTTGSTGNSGGVYVKNGTFTMNGGEISGNTVKGTGGYSYGGGVYVVGDSTFIMNGGKISGNTTLASTVSCGGGVSVNSGGMFTMNGGEIFRNSGGSSGGGVYTANNSTFIMNGGKISDNTSGSRGGGVFVSYNSTFTMAGGKISGNTSGATSSGGGVFIGSDSAFNKMSNAGIIYGYDISNPAATDNKARNGTPAYGHAVYFDKDSGYYRDATLYDADNIATSTVPTLTGAENTVGNWIKK
jgi:hypothetical protein